MAPSPSPEPPPSVGPSLPPTSWDQVFTLERGGLGDLISWRGGLIATGCATDVDGNCSDRIALNSSDGETWDQIEVDIPGNLSFGSIHRVGKRLFALGYANTRKYGGATVLTSVDGRSWNRVGSASFRARAVEDIIGSPLGTVAIGYNAPPDSDNTSGFLMWPVGQDGSFGSVRVVDRENLMAIVTSAIWTGDEFLAWGPRQHPMGGGGPTILLSSPDGKQWTRRAAISAGKDAWVSEIRVVGDRLVAVGYEGRRFPLTPSAWTSDDAGRTWTSADVDGDDAAMATVDVVGSRLVARGIVGWDSTRHVVSWESTDGSVWTRLPDDVDLPLVPGFAGTTPVTVGDRTCVAGSFYEDMPIGAAIYCRT